MSCRAKYPLLLWTVAVVSVSAVSCASDECEDNKNSLPLAEFYSSLPEPEAVSLDSISVYGIGAPGDSLLLDSASNVGQCYLPFRIDEGRTSYVIHYLKKGIAGGTLRDTVAFSYGIRPEFVSSACGAVYYYDNVAIDHTCNLIDSVVCPEGRITNANRANIFIYFRAAEEDVAQLIRR